MTQHPEEGTLHAYIDGELSPAESAALEQHVGECSLCAAALAEARGFVAAASRVITTLDAAPSSAAKPVAPTVLTPAIPPRRAVRPPVFRVPYARAAALLLLVGGTAFVVDRTGMLAGGRTTAAESMMTDAVAERDLAAATPAEAPTTSAVPPVQAPEPAAVGTTLSTGAGSGATRSARQESVAPRREMPAATTDGATRLRAMERGAPVTETPPAALAARGVAGGVAVKDAVSPTTAPPRLAGRVAAAEVARPAAVSAAPPPPAPARMATTLQERAAAAAGALNFAPVTVRYRTAGGIIVTLTEEPLRTSFAEESLATQSPGLRLLTGAELRF